MYSPAQAYDRSSSFLSQLITLAAWLGLAICVIQLYFLIEHGKDFLNGWAGVIHYDPAWNKLIKFYGGIGIVCFGVATGIGLKLIAAGLLAFFLVSSAGSTYYLKNHKTQIELPAVAGSSDEPQTKTPDAVNDSGSTNAAVQHASFGKAVKFMHHNQENRRVWTATARSKNMSVVRPLNIDELNWCNDGRTLDWRNQVNCNTGNIWTYKK